MTFSYRKMTTLRPQKSKWLSTFFIAMLMAAALFVPYIVTGHGYFLFYGDFNVQQVPFYQHCHEMVRSGCFGWDFGTDLGVNFVGSYSFYLLGSPFFWLTIPFPNSVVPYLMGPLLILKFALAALTAYFYIRRFTKNSETARLGGILYAFSGFSVYNIFFNHFHEAIIVFPLLLLSVELLETENRRGVFATMVALSALVNYFFFFGMVVFVIIYWFVRVFSGCFRFRIGRFFTMLFEAVLGVAMAAVLLLPTIMALSGNSRLSEFQTGWGALMYGKEQIYANILECFFFPPDLPARPVFFPEADVKWSSLGGWLPIFSMVGVFAWFQSKKGNWLRRVLGVCVFMSLVPVLNSAFYMFNSAYYARWFYMPILLMCLATCMGIEDREVQWDSAFRWVFGITVAVSLVIGFFPAGIEGGKITRFGLFVYDSNNTYKERFFITCAIAVIGLLILKVLLVQLRRNPHFFIRGATLCVCIMSVIYSSLFVGLGKTHSYDVDGVMIPSLIESTLRLPGDSDTYRIDCYECVDNTGMYLGYNTINAFHSIVPSSVTEFYEYVGEERGVASRPTTDSYAIRPLLSVKYLVDLDDEQNFENDGKTKMKGFSYFATQNGYDIYENKNYIPYGFTYDYYMTDDQCKKYGEDRIADMMLKAMLLSDEQIQKYGGLLKSLSEDYLIDGESDEVRRPVSFSEEAFAADCAERSATAAQSFKTDRSGFTAQINMKRSNLVFFSVPYEEGWSAFVNNEPVKIEKVNVGFMAVKAPEGKCEIRFEYETPGLMTGIEITAVSVLVLIIYTVFATLFVKRYPSDKEYAEGDELIEKWQEYDMEDASQQLNNDDDGNDDETESLDYYEPKINYPNNFVGGFTVRDDVFTDDSVDNGDGK